VVQIRDRIKRAGILQRSFFHGVLYLANWFTVWFGVDTTVDYKDSEELNRDDVGPRNPSAQKTEPHWLAELSVTAPPDHGR
jgi:hypothetical protein